MFWMKRIKELERRVAAVEARVDAVEVQVAENIATRYRLVNSIRCDARDSEAVANAIRRYTRVNGSI